MRIPSFKFFKFNLVHLIIFIVVGAVMTVNAVLAYKTQHKITAEKKEVEEAAKPAEIELIVLSAPECVSCFDINALVAPLKSNEKIKVSSEKTIVYTSDEGAALIQKYGVLRVPTLIVMGNTGKAFDEPSFIQNLGKKAEDGALVVMNMPAPYIDVASGAVKGTFSVTYITDKACKECYDPAMHRGALAGLSMKATTEKFVDRGDEEGRALVAQYKIENVPTIVLTGDLSAYPRFQEVWKTVGTVEKDDSHVFRSGVQLMGTYHNLKTGKVIIPEPPKTDVPAPATPATPTPSTDNNQ
ncbi:MAG: hypothetical protein Q7S48_02250 [bacterium]|nr:hypothetical protein [bacterium]